MYQPVDEFYKPLVLLLSKYKLALNIVIDILTQTVLFVFGHEIAQESGELLVEFVSELQEVLNHLFEVGEHWQGFLYEAVK